MENCEKFQSNLMKRLKIWSKKNMNYSFNSNLFKVKINLIFAPSNCTEDRYHMYKSDIWLMCEWYMSGVAVRVAVGWVGNGVSNEQTLRGIVRHIAIVIAISAQTLPSSNSNQQKWKFLISFVCVRRIRIKQFSRLRLSLVSARLDSVL